MHDTEGYKTPQPQLVSYGNKYDAPSGLHISFVKEQ
jgi:hypothetical protein